MPTPDDNGRLPERELVELRKEVLETRNQMIRTDNQFKALSTELRMLSKRHEEQFRKTWLSSAAAYGGFLLLALGGAYAVGKAVVSRERGFVEAARSEADKLTERAREQSSDLHTHAEKERLEQEESAKALAAYQSMSEGQGEARLKGVDGLTALDKSRLTDLEKRALEDRAKSLRAELSGNFFEQGRAAFRRGDWKGAVAPFKRFLSLEPSEAETHLASYYLGIALVSLKQFAEAIPPLERYATKPKVLKGGDMALLSLGQAYEATGALGKAAQLYLEALKQYPGSASTPTFQSRYRAAVRAISTQENAPDAGHSGTDGGGGTGVAPPP